jgi:phage repressor protein C with HTH and peptisase S24 domain
MDVLEGWGQWRTLAERLSGCRKARGLTQVQLSDRAGVKQSDISKLERGDSMTTAKLPQLARALDVDSFWLSTGTGSPHTAAPMAITVREPAATPYLPGFEQLSVPVLSAAASMGGGIEQHDDIVVGRLTLSPQWVTKTLKPLSRLDNLRFIHGYGDSMEPTFTDGDILLVDAGVFDVKVDGIYVLEANERLYVKRVRQRIDGTFEISSDNPTVKTVDVLTSGSTPVSVKGRVIWAWNGKKL